MDPVVTARVPEGVRDGGVEVLKSIGSTTSELVNAAFDYVIQAKELPRFERVNLCATTHDDMKAACGDGWDDLEDALIGVLCKKVSADYLLTRDEKQAGFKGLGIPSLTPRSSSPCSRSNATCVTAQSSYKRRADTPSYIMFATMYAASWRRLYARID